MRKSDYKQQLLCYISEQIDRLTVKQMRQLIARHAILIKQLMKAEQCMSHKEAKKILKKVDKLNGKHYVEPSK